MGVGGTGAGRAEEEEAESSLCLRVSSHPSRVPEYFPLVPLGLCRLHGAGLEPLPPAWPLRHGGTPHCGGG